VEIARFELLPGCELAIAPHEGGGKVNGTETREPAFGMKAVWVPAGQADQARKSGYTVVDPISVVGTHLAEVVRSHAHELFSRQDAKALLDRVSEQNARVVEDLVPKLLPLSVVQKILQNLLRERVSIRDAVSILEAVSEAAQITKNPFLLTDYVRQAIRRMVVKPYLNSNGELPAFLLDASLDQAIESAVEHTEHASHLNLPPQQIREVTDRISKAVGKTEGPMVLLTGAGARSFVRQIVESTLRNLAVISHSEIPSGVRVVSLGLAK
jgi:flagellar biosynthesis protein FlhA